MRYWGIILLSGIALLGFTNEGQGKALSPHNRTSIRCAMEKMRIMTEFFDVRLSSDKKVYTLPAECGGGREQKISAPKWFTEQLPKMNSNKIAYLPQDGTWSEADFWKDAFRQVYFFLERADQSLNPEQPLVLEQLSRGYIGNRLALMRTLDYLNKDLTRNGKTLFSMKDSMDGRGRSLLSTLELINSEFFSTAEALSSSLQKREDKYRQSVIAVVVLVNHLFSQFFADPIPTFPPDMSDPKNYKATQPNQAAYLFLLLLGSALAGFAVYLLLENKKENITTFLEEYQKKSSAWAEDFNRQFVTIDIKYIVFGTITLFVIGGFLVGLVVGGFTGVFFFLLIVLLGGVVSVRMPMAVLDALKKSRGRKVNAQLMDSLILLSNSLRSGMDIVQGFELVSKDMLPPIADEFGLVVKNYQLGTPFEQALDGLTDRVDSRMLSYIVKAIVIQRQVGGNLTVIFSRLVENIREESKLEEKLQAMTAQQKIQSIVVSVMPFVMMLVMFIFNPSQMISFYTSPVGLFVFLFCIVWIGIGMKILKKMGEVRV